jgi:hypothetical protein
MQKKDQPIAADRPLSGYKADSKKADTQKSETPKPEPSPVNGEFIRV